MAEGHYRGALEAGLKPATEGEAAEADEDASTGRPAAGPEHLAKFLTLAVGQFEQRFTIMPEEKLEALYRVVKGLQPPRAKGRKPVSKWTGDVRLAAFMFSSRGRWLGR
jgi:hypothetical protein